MNDIKNPKTKKPMIYYYVIALLVFMLLNTFLFPSLFRRTEREVDYSTFMNQLNEGQIQQVEVQDQKIEYILKDQEDWNIYVTGNMGDPNLAFCASYFTNGCAISKSGRFSAILSSSLYLAIRSERDIEPVLI